MMKTICLPIVLLAFASFFRTGDAQFTGWTTPSITGAADGTGTLSLAESHAIAATSTTYAATPGTGASVVSYEVITSGVPFSIDNSGVFSVTAALDHETDASYTVEIRVVDDVTPTANSGTATITITITDVNEADPVLSGISGTVCILDNSVAGTDVATATATDADTSQTIALTFSGSTDFELLSTGVIQVDTVNGVTLDKTTSGSYTLTVTAIDNVATFRTVSASMTVTVADTCPCSSAMAAAASVLLLLVALLATLF